MKNFFLYPVVFVSLFLLAGGIVSLKKGIRIDGLTIGSATLSNISLEWKSKLELHVDKLVIAYASDKEQQVSGANIFDDLLPLVVWVDRLFTKISLQSVNVGTMNGDFRYEASLFHLNFTSSFAELQAILRLDGTLLLAEIESLNNKQFCSRASGTLQIDLQEESAHGHLSVNIAESLPVLLTFTADRTRVSFQGKENGVITDIVPFVDLLGLDQNIQPWIADYLTGSRYTLKTFTGDFPWDNPLHLLKSFYAEVRVKDCAYTFAPGLEPIKTDYTDLVFQDGVLTISPFNPTFYGQDAAREPDLANFGQDAVKIHFTDLDNIILTAHIKTRAMGNMDIVNLLKYYDIPLPFEQTEGLTEIDLTLGVNLNNDNVTASGIFRIESGRIRSGIEIFRVENVEVTLKDSYISINNVDLEYKEMFAGRISGYFDAGAEQGNIDVVMRALKIPVRNSVLTMDDSAVPVKIRYQIRPYHSSVIVQKSFWKMDELSFYLAGFMTPLSLDDFSGELPSVMLTLPNQVEMKLSGLFSLKEKEADLRCILQKFNVQGVQLLSKKAPFQLHYKNGLTLKNLKESRWSIEQKPFTLETATFTYKDNNVSFADVGITYDTIFNGIFSGKYNLAQSSGKFIVEKPRFLNDDLSALLSPQTKLTVQVDGTEQLFSILVPELDLTVTTGKNKEWSASISDLQAIHDHSPLLQQFKVVSGKVSVSSATGGAPYKFTADIPWSYPVLVYENKPFSNFLVKGEINEKGDVRAEVNEHLTITFKESVEITSDHIAYNLPAIIQLIEECTKPEEKKRTGKSRLETTLTATDSALYLAPNRKVVADSMILYSKKGSTDMELISDSGIIVAGIKRGRFSLQGEGLTDSFINNLSPDAHLRGGRMKIAVKGAFDDFSAVVQIDDTVLLDWHTLNNVLALLNTIPALITFHLPGYSNYGLEVSSLVAGVRVKEGLVTVESLHLDSSQLDIVGNGWINIPQEKIQMDLNLTTRSKKYIGNIPLVGYILAGEKKHPSITVKVSGDLMDPDVEHEMFKEAVKKPFGILYRTLSLPAYLVTPLFGSGDEEEH